MNNTNTNNETPLTMEQQNIQDRINRDQAALDRDRDELNRERDRFQREQQDLAEAGERAARRATGSRIPGSLFAQPTYPGSNLEAMIHFNLTTEQMRTRWVEDYKIWLRDDLWDAELYLMSQDPLTAIGPQTSGLYIGLNFEDDGEEPLDEDALPTAAARIMAQLADDYLHPSNVDDWFEDNGYCRERGTQSDSADVAVFRSVCLGVHSACHSRQPWAFQEWLNKQRRRSNRLTTPDDYLLGEGDDGELAECAGYAPE
tara:strand:+ start:797 stop:1570 length:774 start_codon:yes stop_codon:yes gene_type:complete